MHDVTTTADANILENGMHLTVMGLNEDDPILTAKSPASSLHENQ